MCPKGIMSVFKGHAQLQTERSTGGSLLPFYTPPKTGYLLNRYYVIIAKSQGAVRGDTHSPLRHHTSVCISYH
jgi:hypothetical protein